ncbi:MAG: DNA polymerase [Nitrospiraceae bacterium]
MSVLSIDFESRSTLDLAKVGVYKYAAHPSTDVWCMAWAFDGEEPGVWIPLPIVTRGEQADLYRSDFGRFPQRVIEHVRAGGEIRAWNANFERIMWREIMVKRYGFPETELEQFVDTAAEAAALALPRALEDAAKVLGLPNEKDMAGRRLMLQMCKPRKPSRKDTYRDPNPCKKHNIASCLGCDIQIPIPRILWWDDGDRRARLYEYCKQDVRVEQAVAKRIKPLLPLEREVYLMDQRMNDRGVYVDLPLVRAAKKLVDEAMRRANGDLDEATGGQATSVTKVADIKRWLKYRGMEIPSLSKDVVRDLLVTDLPDDVKEALTIRSEAGKASTSKLKAFEASTSDDSRARGLLLFHAASTGRWGGKRVQPQNFPRPVLKAEQFIDRVMAGDYDMIDIEAPVPVVISSMLRSMIRAAPGNVLRGGDYAQIEARVLAWIAEQDDLVELFATGGKIYETMAAVIYGLAIEDIAKDSPERQIGKNAVLGCGFGMGADRFAEQVQEQTGIVLDRGKRNDKGELLPGEVDQAQQVIDAYRSTYAKIKQFWKDIEDAAKNAIREPGTVHRVGRGGSIRYTVRGQFLWCALPSGRLLAYAKPSLRQRKVVRKDGTSFVTTSIAYMGVDQFTRRWQRQYSYGGHLTENVVQAMARDLMAAAMLRAERAGYTPVLTVHDEIVTETPEDFGSLEEFLKIMRTRPKWAAGLPVGADGWEGIRYRK